MKNDPARWGRAVECHRQADNNVPTENCGSTQSNAADAVDLFMPGCDATERALRVRIHRARDVAVARATRSRHGAAREIFWLAARSAELRVFAYASEAELRETIDNLARMFLVANWVERTEMRDVG
jgi:hypothetical protein